jgi:hypothetical protein
VTHAAFGNADPIVMRTHGRRGVRRVLFGSDAAEIVSLATIPGMLERTWAQEESCLGDRRQVDVQCRQVLSRSYPGRVQTGRAGLAGSHAVNDPQGTNLIRVILEGTSAPDHAAATAMPSFGAAYTNAEVAAVANYVIGHYGGKQGQVTAKDVAAARP